MPGSIIPTPIKTLIRHTPLMLGLAFGVAIWAVLAVAPNDLAPLTRVLSGWDLGVLAYLATTFTQMHEADRKQLAARAAETDEGRYFVLAVSMVAVIASVTAIVLELQSHVQAGPMKTLHVAFVFVTVALSWLFVHTSFAKHYAHEYFGPGAGGIRKGLLFPGEDDPDFGDFLHFALVIGVANQTADVQITAKAIRRIVTLHGIAAFVFNTIILALTINLAAGLFQ